MTANTTRNAAPQPPAPPTDAAAPQPAPYAPVGRIPVTEVFPVVEDGRWPAKAVPGEVMPIRATVFREGHDSFGATAVLVRPDGTDGPRARMVEILPGLDRYEARLAPDAPGDWGLRVEGWSDPYATWAHAAGIKVPAGVDAVLMLEEGARVLDRAAALPGRDPDDAAILARAAERLRDESLPDGERLDAGLADAVVEVLDRLPLRDHVSPSATYPLQVDRERALAGSCLLYTSPSPRD